MEYNTENFLLEGDYELTEGYVAWLDEQADRAEYERSFDY